MSSKNGNFTDVDARVLITELTAMEFIANLVSDPRWAVVGFLKNYYTNTSTKEEKRVGVTGKLMPADSTGTIQVKSSYDTTDWMFSTIKHGIKHEFGEMETNDLQVSGAWLEIFKGIKNNAVNWFFELIGKYLEGLVTGQVVYFDENGNLMGVEEVKVLDGEDFVVPAGRVSGLWYQNTDNNTTTNKEDVSPNYDTSPIAQASFIAGHRAIHKHRLPSVGGDGKHLLVHREHYVLCHPDKVYDLQVLLDPNVYMDASYSDIKPLLGKYKIIPVQFPNPDFWMQATDAHTIGIVAFTGQTHDNRQIYPTISKGDVSKETGNRVYYETSQVGIAAKTPTGVFIHNV